MSVGFELDLRQQTSNNIYQLLNENGELYDTIENLIAEGRSRFILGIHDFDRIGSKLANLILNNPLLYLSACEEGYQRVFEAIYSARVAQGKLAPVYPPHLGLRDWLGSHTVTPRGLCSRLVNRLVCVEGIVTRCSLVRPKLARSVHVSDENGFTITREHHDSSSLQKDFQLVSRGVPKTDKDGNPLRVEVALCAFRDSQVITLQETPESAPTGQLPRSVDIILDDDLVDAVKPGDRVRVFGVYRAVVLKDTSRLTGISRAFLIANNVEHLKQDVLTPDLSPIDIRTIREIAARPDTFDILSQSIAPSICGHDLVKKGLLLQMLGGERKELENGMKLRGDIHVLLIGDPSCGKSQLLRFMMNTAPLTLSTTGRGSSGVGLTAAVSTDKESGERRLEAGAMVLGDGGLVCIDEFDKMSSEDRVAIHEVMEQQTVTISKAGIQTSLNARTTVLAAANPVYGSFDPSVSLKSQITFPDSLLTRFDLIYIIRDTQSAEDDRRICSQVIRQLQQHTDLENNSAARNRQSCCNDEAWGVIQPVVDHKKTQGEARYWETSILPSSSVASETQVQKVLSVPFLQKYIYYAKNARKPPVLGDDAITSIVKFYSNLRQNFAGHHVDRGHVIPTTRTLEACVRLATAHAKLKLKSIIDEEDASEAQLLLLYTLTGEIPEGYTKTGMKLRTNSSVSNSIPQQQLKEKRKRPRANHDLNEVTASDISNGKRRQNHAPLSTPNNKAVDGASSTPLISTPQLATSLMPSRDIENADDGGSQASAESLEWSQERSGMVNMTTKRMKFFTKLVSEIQRNLTTDSILPPDLFSLLNERSTSSKNFSWEEFLSGVRQLQSANKLVNDEIWFI